MTTHTRRLLEVSDFISMRIPMQYRSVLPEKMQRVTYATPPSLLAQFGPVVTQDAAKFMIRFRDLTVNKVPAFRGRGLLFYGESGVGKTALACWLLAQLRAWIPRSSALFTTVPDLYGAYREPWKSEQVTREENLHQRLSSVQFLVIDGLAPLASHHLGFTAEALRMLVDTRNQGNRATFITTAMTPEEIQQELPEIASLSYVMPVEVEGEDLRHPAEDKARELLLAELLTD